MPRTSYQPVPAYAEPTAAPSRRDDRAARRTAGRRRMASFFALLLVLAAVAAVGVALVASGNKGSGVSPINDDNVQQQIQDLRQFIQEHSR
jgi:predicted PurR-regulated permease PerM